MSDAKLQEEAGVKPASKINDQTCAEIIGILSPVLQLMKYKNYNVLEEKILDNLKNSLEFRMVFDLNRNDWNVTPPDGFRCYVDDMLEGFIYNEVVYTGTLSEDAVKLLAQIKEINSQLLTWAGLLLPLARLRIVIGGIDNKHKYKAEEIFTKRLKFEYVNVDYLEEMEEDGYVTDLIDKSKSWLEAVKYIYWNEEASVVRKVKKELKSKACFKNICHSPYSIQEGLSIDRGFLV